MILLTFDTVALNLSNITPLLFLYTLSMIHEKNQNFTSGDLFFSNIAYFSGKALGTFITNILIIRFGFRKLFLFSGLFYFSSMELLRKTSSVFSICLSYLLQGIGYSIIYDLNNIFLAQKYKGGIFLAKYLHITRIVLNSVIVYAFDHYVNPDDVQTTVMHNGVSYYDQSVTSRLEQALYVFEIIIIGCIGLTGVLLQIPNSISGQKNEQQNNFTSINFG